MKPSGLLGQERKTGGLRAGVLKDPALEYLSPREDAFDLRGSLRGLLSSLRNSLH